MGKQKSRMHNKYLTNITTQQTRDVEPVLI